MPEYATEALILRTYKLGESDRIVVFLTRDRGKKRGVAKNARQSRRRFGGGLEPMTCGRVVYVERERRDLVLVNYIEPTRSPLTAASSDSLGMGFPAELLDECAPKQTRTKGLFRLGVSTVDALGGWRSRRTARQVLRVLAAAAAGSLSTGPAGVERRAGVSRDGSNMRAAGSRRNARGPRHAARARDRASHPARNAPGKGAAIDESAERAGKIGKCRLSIW